MPNDLSTLNGSLVEMKDQLIYELGEKGVTASYDSTTGLLGLIGKISDIQQGGSCYHIEFGEASYTAIGGSATLEIYLQENYAPKSGASVTLTGSDGSVYNGITNSNGIAQVTVNNVSGTVTFTGSYSNVSTQCTVTAQTHLYAPQLDGTETIYQINGTTTVADGVMSGGTCYLTTGWDNTIDWELSFEAYYVDRDGESIQLSFGNPTQADYNCIRFLCPAYNRIQTNKPSTVYNDGSLNKVTQSTWLSFNVKRVGNNMTVKIGNNNATTHTYRFSEFERVCIGTNSWGNVAKLRNIIVDAL